MEFFKLTEMPFYTTRPKVKSGAEINIRVKFNQQAGKVERTAPAWVNKKRNFQPIFLN